MRKQEPAAGQPAVTLPGVVTDLDRQIVARREAGETRKAICEALGVTVGQIYHAEYACQCDANGRKLLAGRADSIEGLSYINELDGNAADRLRYHHYHHESPELAGLSDVAALGRPYVSRINGIGPKSLASIDRALGLFGMTWAPVDRTPKPKPREPKQPAIDDTRGDVWALVGRLQVEIEEVRRQIEELSGRQSPAGEGRDDLESSGNLICLPGVKLASVLCNDGSDPGPTAA